MEFRPKDDQFQFSVLEVEIVPKRGILSVISKIFDPLDLIGSILTAVKLIMRQTWLTERNGDESLPPSLATKWANFRKDLNEAKIYVSRQVVPNETLSRIYHRILMSPKARMERVYTFRLSAAKTAFQQICVPNLVLQIASDTNQIYFYDWSCAARSCALNH